MKVAELIGKLLTMPMNSEVFVAYDGQEYEPNPTLEEDVESGKPPKVLF